MLRIIGGIFKGHRLKVPQEKNIRPTSEKVRKAVFDMCAFKVQNAHFLDLFSGSGAIGIEALSRGAANVVFVEKNPKIARVIRENIEKLDLATHCTIMLKDVLKALPLFINNQELFDIIFIDAPYAFYTEKTVSILLSYLQALLSTNGLLLIEDPGKIDYKKICSEFPSLKWEFTRKYGDTYIQKITNPGCM